jgi:dinuclear metal center YbgI/SA1388 family protein
MAAPDNAPPAPTASDGPATSGDRVGDWLDLVHAQYPPADAAEWDEVGLHVGAPDDPVTAVLLSLDVTSEVIDEAVGRGANLVLAHHPLLLRGLGRLTPDTAAGRLALHAARRGVAVAAAHTNLDVAVGGTSDPVTALLGLADVRPLVPTEGRATTKLVTFVPSEATPAVLAALSAAGAGHIGEYTSCSFRTPGTGTFQPSSAAHPTVGQRERLNEVAEDRLEMVVDAGRTGAVLDALRSAHPYEEVAYDLVPLAAAPSTTKGLGRIGDLPAPRSLADLADAIARELPSPHLRLAGDPDRRVQRVAVCGGAGDSLIRAARVAGAELYVTGDLRHHPTLDATTQGLALVDAGHYWMEVAALPGVAADLSRLAAERGLRARLIPSTTRTDPWVWPDRLGQAHPPALRVGSEGHRGSEAALVQRKGTS